VGCILAPLRGWERVRHPSGAMPGVVFSYKILSL